MATKKPATKNGQPAITVTAKKKADNGLSSKQQAVIDYLAKAKATSTTTAVERGKVWKACDVGTSVIVTLKSMKLMDRHDAEDGTKSYYLLAAGKKLANGKG